VNDRIFSTSVDLSYTFSPVQLSSPKDDKKLEFVVPDGANLAGGAWDGSGVAERARKVTLEVFATDESASVQVRANLRSN
jgi:urate oxidase